MGRKPSSQGAQLGIGIQTAQHAPILSHSGNNKHFTLHYEIHSRTIIGLKSEVERKSKFLLLFKDVPALPTSQVYRKIQNACQKSEN